MDYVVAIYKNRNRTQNLQQSTQETKSLHTIKKTLEASLLLIRFAGSQVAISNNNPGG